MTTRTVSTQADLDAALGMCKLHWRQSRTAPRPAAPTRVREQPKVRTTPAPKVAVATPPKLPPGWFAASASRPKREAIVKVRDIGHTPPLNTELVAVAIRVLAARGASDLAEMLGLTGGRVVAS